MYMFCEVLLYSRTKEFYKRERKNNVKRGWLKDQKEQKAREEIRERVSQGVRSIYFIVLTTKFDILRIWMWT